jgi:hypothetical protein
MNVFGGYNARYALSHPWVIVSNAWRRSKWFLQRGWRGYADCDTWDLHGYLTGWLPGALTRLKYDNRFGYPVGFKCRCEWEATLSKMISAFEANKRIIELDFKVEKRGKNRFKEYHRLNRQAKKGLLLFIEHFNSLWD